MKKGSEKGKEREEEGRKGGGREGRGRWEGEGGRGRTVRRKE